MVVPHTDREYITANATVVTAYFNVRSKHDKSSYHEWMQNMLGLQDPMVIFTSHDDVSQIRAFRSHALDRTVIIPMHVENLPVANMFSMEFWENQLAIDVERGLHKSYMVFWIWLSKSWFVSRAVHHNFFQSSVFVWSDIGCFRWPKYKHEDLVQHVELVPRWSILSMAHSEPIAPKDLFWNSKFDTPENFYHSGSMAVGYGDTWHKFHRLFVSTMRGFAQRQMFIGEDQAVLQSTCRQNPSYCAYVHPSDVVGRDKWREMEKEGKLDEFSDLRYFGIQEVLHDGGNFTLWRPPPLTPEETEQIEP